MGECVWLESGELSREELRVFLKACRDTGIVRWREKCWLIWSHTMGFGSNIKHKFQLLSIDPGNCE